MTGFGWAYPPGCTPQDVDDAMGGTPETCPECGSHDTDIVPVSGGLGLRCADCGTEWS